ncbi:hypothetical protein FRC11_010852, partial [Ceratobasidium sp. 423]
MPTSRQLAEKSPLAHSSIAQDPVLDNCQALTPPGRLAPFPSTSYMPNHRQFDPSLPPLMVAPAGEGLPRIWVPRLSQRRRSGESLSV